MDIFSIFGVVMGIFMISLCAIYARTKRIGYNNLFTVLLFGVGAIALTTLTVIYTKWWMVGIETWALFVVWLYLRNNYRKVKRQLNSYSKKNKTRTVLRDLSDWIYPIILITISITVLVKCWYIPDRTENILVVFVFIPIVALCLTALAVMLHDTLKDI